MLRTNRQTDKQTVKQTDWKILPTPTEIVGGGNNNNNTTTQNLQPGHLFKNKVGLYIIIGSRKLKKLPSIRQKLLSFEINLEHFIDKQRNKSLGSN